MNRTFFFIAILFLSSFAACSQKSKLSYYDSSYTMPPFNYYLLNGTSFTPNNLSKKHNTMMVYFKNECPYCQKEATIIFENIKQFADIDFVFISRDDSTSIINFAKANKLDNTPNIKFVQDKDKLYYTFCKATYTPSIHIYNKHQQLMMFDEGTMKKDEIEKYIR